MKTKLCLSSIFCIYFLIVSFRAVGQEKYYYGYDEKIPLHEVKNKVVISISPNSLSEIETALLAHQQIKSVERKGNSMLILETELTPQELRKYDFRGLKGVKSIQAVYICGESEIYITDEIVVKFYDNINQGIIKRFA